MKFAISVTLAAFLVFSPALCMALACDLGLSHDCCPKSHEMTNCPYDVLATAKVVNAQAVGVVTQVSVMVPIELSLRWVLPGFETIATEHDNFQHRVLRI